MASPGGISRYNARYGPPNLRETAPIQWTSSSHSAKGRHQIRRVSAVSAAPVSRTSNRQIGEEARVQVLVRDNNVDQALKALKKKMQREGIFREMKLRDHYEKPSEKKAREKAEAIRRAR